MHFWWQEKQYRSLVESVLHQINTCVTPASHAPIPIDVRYQHYAAALKLVIDVLPDIPDIREKFDHIFTRSIIETIEVPQITPSNIDAMHEAVETLFNRPSHRLAIYGSLAPGKTNHHVVADVRGEWHSGTVFGQLSQTGWGSDIGFPALTWIPGTDPIEVQVLESAELPDHWQRLDEFEGEQYKRICIPVERKDHPLEIANIYVGVDS